jgi:hypothetical protein
MGLSSRNRRTLEAVARTMVPPGGVVEAGADELDLPQKIAGEVDTYPRFAHNQVRLLLFAIEHYPLISGLRRRFSRLSPEEQAVFLEKTAHHKRSALRRLVVSYLKSIVFGAFISHPETEAVIGYRYECLKPLAGSIAEEQVHH